eukprot:37353_1
MDVDGTQTEGDYTRNCGVMNQFSGEWDGFDPICRVNTTFCPELSIMNGLVGAHERSIDSVVSYSCGIGTDFVVDGNVVDPTSFERSCTKFGNWSGSDPQCRVQSVAMLLDTLMIFQQSGISEEDQIQIIIPLFQQNLANATQSEAANKVLSEIITDIFQNNNESGTESFTFSTEGATTIARTITPSDNSGEPTQVPPQMLEDGTQIFFPPLELPNGDILLLIHIIGNFGTSGASTGAMLLEDPQVLLSNFRNAIATLPSISNIIGVTFFNSNGSADATSEPLVIENLSPCSPITIFFPYSDPRIYDQLRLTNSPEPVCRFYDESTGQFTSDIVMSGFNATGVNCSTTHLTFFDVGWDDLIPPFTFLSIGDFRNITIGNLLDYPTGLITLGILVVLFIPFMVWGYVHDRRIAKQCVRQNNQNGLVVHNNKLVRDNDFLWIILTDGQLVKYQQLVRIFLFRLKNEHRYMAVFFRERLSRFQTLERVTVLLMYLTSVLAMAAVFHGRRENALNVITIAFMTSIASVIPATFVAFLYKNGRSSRQEKVFGRGLDDVRAASRESDDHTIDASYLEEGGQEATSSRHSDRNEPEVFAKIESLGLNYKNLESGGRQSSLRRIPTAMKRTFYENVLSIDYNDTVVDPQKLNYSYPAWVKRLAFAFSIFWSLGMVMLILVYTLRLDITNEANVSFFTTCASMQSGPLGALSTSETFAWLQSVGIALAIDIGLIQPFILFMMSVCAVWLFAGQTSRKSEPQQSLDSFNGQRDMSFTFTASNSMVSFSCDSFRLSREICSSSQSDIMY